MERRIILALDIGSSSIRCTAYSVHEDGHLSTAICSASNKVRTVQPDTGMIQLAYGTETLQDSIDECIDKALKQLKKEDVPQQIVAVGFTTFVMNLIAVDQEGHVLGDQYTLSYACNTPEVAQECKDLRKQLGTDRLHHLYQQTGAPIHSAYALPQLRTLYRTSPAQAIDRIYKWQSLASLCLCRWTGQITFPISYSEASWTGLLNFRHCAYEYEATELLPRGCLGTLPRLADFSEYWSGLPETTTTGTKNRYWTMWPELRQAKFFLGIGDGACANIGSKCSTATRIAVTIGTSAAARICLYHGVGPSCSLPIVPSGLFCYRVDQNHVLVGGALTDGGSVIEWLSELLNLTTGEAFVNCINQTQELITAEYKDLVSSLSSGTLSPATTVATPSQQHLVSIPFLSGERSTGFRDGASGAIMGLTRNTTSAHILKACLEGISLRLRAILELIIQARESISLPSRVDDDNTNNNTPPQLPPPCIVASGKSLEVNAMWRQMVADCSGLKVMLDRDTVEGTSRGAARLVAVALNAFDKGVPMVLEEEHLTSVKTVKPRPQAEAFYNHAALKQSQFIDAMVPLWNN